MDVFNAEDKLDTKSVPPLKAGESFTFTYVSIRSSQAGKGTTQLGFQLDPIPASAAVWETTTHTLPVLG